MDVQAESERQMCECRVPEGERKTDVEIRARQSEQTLK